jgi:hypothetical protein
VNAWRGFQCAVLTLMLIPMAWAQSRRDPLNQLEIDQLRDTAQEPDLRLKLYVQFARARLASLEQVRSDPKATDRAQQIHDRLQDFLDVYDELEGNIDNFVDRKDDIRKPLKAIIEADTEFQARLRAVKTSSDAAKAEAQRYEFLLSNAMETIDSGAEGHRQLLAELEEAAKHKKVKAAAKP